MMLGNTCHANQPDGICIKHALNAAGLLSQLCDAPCTVLQHAQCWTGIGALHWCFALVLCIGALH